MTMAGTRVHAFADDALGRDDAVGLVARMRDGEVSAAEVVDAAVSRAERVQPALHGLCYQAFDRARAEARDPRPGYFSGVPTVVKDNVDVAGMPTQHGSRAWVARTAKQDGSCPRCPSRAPTAAARSTSRSPWPRSGTGGTRAR